MGFVATGLSDEALAELTDMFRELILLEKGMEVEIKPAVVFEVAYEEYNKSRTTPPDMPSVFPGWSP